MMATSEFYNEFESTTGPSLSFRMSRVIELAGRFEIHSMLDIGCGDGIFTDAFALACHCHEIVGIDTSRRLVQHANSRFPTIVSDFSAPLPLKDASFDAVLCSEVIEHLIDPDLLLSEISRVLAPR